VEKKTVMKREIIRRGWGVLENEENKMEISLLEGLNNGSNKKNKIRTMEVKERSDGKSR
jgi:hypothetical protein